MKCNEDKKISTQANPNGVVLQNEVVFKMKQAIFTKKTKQNIIQPANPNEVVLQIEVVFKWNMFITKRKRKGHMQQGNQNKAVFK